MIRFLDTADKKLELLPLIPQCENSISLKWQFKKKNCTILFLFSAHCATKLPTIYSGPPTTSENNTESDSDEVDDDDLECEESSSECGECCGGHAPYPTLTRAPNIIPATMCKSTQISPTTVIEMYAAAASIRRRNTNSASTTSASIASSVHSELKCRKKSIFTGQYCTVCLKG